MVLGFEANKRHLNCFAKGISFFLSRMRQHGVGSRIISFLFLFPTFFISLLAVTS